MTAYYNENDPFAAAWLRELIRDGWIAPGDVDERSITEVQPDDIAPYTQHHFFAGIGGWSYALRVAGWKDTRPIWTGSCPCQPFSVAGKRAGTADARHLWPEFARLIRECRPAIVFGEQVASKDGRLWLAGVRADLEGMGYAVGAADLCAAGIGAPHIRQRLYWVADAERGATERRRYDMAGAAQGIEGEAPERQRLRDESRTGGDAGRLDDAASARWQSAGERPESEAWDEARLRGPERGRGVGRLEHALDAGLEGHAGHGDDGDESRRLDALPPGPASAYGDARWLRCLDGKDRRVPLESALFPLVDGVPNRVGTLRGAGNAIVPPLAAEFIRAFEDVSR